MTTKEQERQAIEKIRLWKDSEKTVTSDSRWMGFWNWQRITFEKTLRIA